MCYVFIKWRLTTNRTDMHVRISTLLEELTHSVGVFSF